MLAKAMAILSGLQLATDLDVMFLWIEINSLELLHILQGSHRCPWWLHYIFDSIYKLGKYVCVISHVMCEGNQGADSLANEAIRRDGGQVFRD